MAVESGEVLLLPNLVWGSFEDTSGFGTHAESPAVAKWMKDRAERVCPQFRLVGTPGMAATIQVTSRPPEAIAATTDSGREVPSGVLLIRAWTSQDDKGRGATGAHVVFVPGDMYHLLDDQPFGLFRSGFVRDSWEGERALAPLQVSTEAARLIAVPEIAPSQMDVLEKQIRHLLKGGEVRLYTDGSSSALADHFEALYLGLPNAVRESGWFGIGLKSDRVGVVRTSSAERFVLCGIHNRGSIFEPGAAELSEELGPAFASEGEIESHVSEYRRCLLERDLTALRALRTRELAPPQSSRKPTGRRSWFR
jgi:hypothetical protein